MHHALPRSRRLLIGLAGLLAVGAGFLALERPDRFDGHPVDGRRLALLNARVYDPGTDRVMENATILVDGREIVGVASHARAPADAEILNLQGLTVLPGLIDSHVHLSGSPGRQHRGRLGWVSYLWRFLHGFPERRRALIEAGVTTAKSLGDPYPWIVEFADRIDSHELAGPRIFSGGPMLTAPGGYPVSRFRAVGRGDTSFIVQVARQLGDPESAGAAVEGLAGRVDFITLTLESDRPGLPTLGLDLIREATARARAHDLPALVHIGSADDLELALAGRARGIEHLPTDRRIDWGTARRLQERRVFVDPTLGRVSVLHPASSGNRMEVARANVKRLFRAGVLLVAGSDAPHTGPFGWSLHQELRALVEAGLSPADAIASATALAAEHLGLRDRIGSIAPGLAADLIAVQGDPLTDIYTLSEVILVIADGQILLDRTDRIRRADRVFARAGSV